MILSTVWVPRFVFAAQSVKWNSDTGEMEKSVCLTPNGDLKDSIGGFNLGRPTGYIEDFNALDDATKQVIRSVKRSWLLRYSHTG